MNLKIQMMNGNDELCYCIISKDADRTEELEKVFSIRKGAGFSIEHDANTVRIVDYFHGENRAVFKIISAEETDEDTVYQPKKI